MAQPNYFNAPIPGQSLTQDPASGGPWERPPKFNTVNQAVDHMFQVVTSRGFMHSYDKLLAEDKKFYIDELISGMLSDGFMKGLWTVDTMTLMVEPMTVLMVWVAAQLNRSPSFSTDTGFEDRTGFEDLIGMTDELSQFDEGDESQQDTQEAPQDTQQSPLVQGNQSPLVQQQPVSGGNL